MLARTLPDPPRFSPSPALLPAPRLPSPPPGPDLRQPHGFRHRRLSRGTPRLHPAPPEHVLPPAPPPVLPASSPAAPPGVCKVGATSSHPGDLLAAGPTGHRPRATSPSPGGASETTPDPVRERGDISPGRLVPALLSRRTPLPVLSAQAETLVVINEQRTGPRGCHTGCHCHHCLAKARVAGLAPLVNLGLHLKHPENSWAPSAGGFPRYSPQIPLQPWPCFPAGLGNRVWRPHPQ